MMLSYSYFNGKEMIWVADSNSLYQELLKKIREVFNVKCFEDGGLMQSEVVTLLDNFLIFKLGKR